MKRLPLAIAVLAALCIAAPVMAEKQKARAKTLQDLEGRKVEVRQGQPVQPDPAKAMENYRAFLDLESSDPTLRVEALRRLADLNLEASEVERAEREQAVAGGVQGTEAIKLYTLLLKSYPEYPGTDAVLYQLARAYDSNAQPNEALAALDRMVGSFPSSRLVDEAQFRRGEILFGLQRYVDAEQAYASVVRNGVNSTFYEQSLYKDGWALFKLARNEESLQAFGQLLDRKLIVQDQRAGQPAMVDIQGLPRPEQELINDSLRVTSILFSYMDGADSAGEFVGRRGSPPYSWLIYARLGDLYLEKERFQDAAQTYEAFVKRDPIDPNAPLLQVRAIEAYRKAGFASLVLSGKQNFVERYGFGAPFWEGRDPKQFSQVVAELKVSVMELARHFHAQAQKEASAVAAAAKSRKPMTADAVAAANGRIQAGYQQAARGYRNYLTWFPEEPESPNTNFLLAEALFESKQYRDAATEYERTAYHYPAHARSMEAGYAALLAYAEEEKQLSGEQKSVWHAKGVESGLMFASTWPTHAQAPVILTRTARELFDLKDLDRAVETADRVLALQPPVDADKRRVALTVIAHSRFDQQRYADAESAYQQLLGSIGRNDPERAALNEKLAASIYRQAEAKQAQGDSGGAVDAFLRVAQVAPDSSISKNAEYDAAAALVNSKQWPRAIEVLESFRRNHPQDPLAAEATRSLAIAYTETQQPERAAAEFERIAEAPPPAVDAGDGATDVRREALWRAGELYEKANDAAGAARIYEKYVRRYPQSFDRTLEARQHLADQAARSQDLKTRDRWLKEIIDADRTAAARTDRSKYLAAKATWVLAEPQGAAFAAVKLRAPLKKSLATKKQAMEHALEAYGRAAQYRVAEVTTAATYSMAELYRTLAKDLMGSERPAKLSADELEQYNLLLEEQAFPFEEKAIGIHQANVARTTDGLYDEWVRKSFAALAELQPVRYAKAEPELNSFPTDAAALAAMETGLKGQVTRSPADAAVQTRLGIVQRLQGRFKEAQATYEQALTSDPNYAPAVLSLGVLYDLYLQDPQRALESYERYQQMSENSDKGVANWIAELKRRLGSNPQPTKETSTS